MALSLFDREILECMILEEIQKYDSSIGSFDEVETLFNDYLVRKRTESDVSKFIAKTVTSEQVESGSSCVICTECFQLNETILTLTCNHIFHEDCIWEWLKKKPNCPFCRMQFTLHFADQEGYLLHNYDITASIDCWNEFLNTLSANSRDQSV